jgi:hypothetical protein
MDMRNATNAKLQIMGQLLAKDDESKQWAEVGMRLKQYHKYQIQRKRIMSNFCLFCGQLGPLFVGMFGLF